MGWALCLVSPLLVGSCTLVVHVCRPGVYMQNCRVYEKSVLRTCRIGVRVHVDVVCFSYKVVQNPPSVYSKPNSQRQMCTCKITSRVRVRKKCFSYMQNWGNCACRCGMFFVQGGPEPAFCILLCLYGSRVSGAGKRSSGLLESFEFLHQVHKSAPCAILSKALFTNTYVSSHIKMTNKLHVITHDLSLKSGNNILNPITRKSSIAMTMIQS